MGQDSKIGWTHHTFNPWWGCEKVSPGCKHCYAATFANRLGWSSKGTKKLPLWGSGSRRKMASEQYWTQPGKWQRAALKADDRRRVFCASMADVFERLPDGHPDTEAVFRARSMLDRQIGKTPNLDWLLLTKRPEQIAATLAKWECDLSNVWLGATVEDMQRAKQRVIWLLENGDAAPVRFLSMEPLLEPVDLTRITLVDAAPPNEPGVTLNALTGYAKEPDDMYPPVNWVIIGGESGAGARPFNLGWALDIINQCRAHNVPVFVKQLGSKPVDESGKPLKLWHRNGDQPGEWPEWLRIQEFPDA